MQLKKRLYSYKRNTGSKLMMQVLEMDYNNGAAKDFIKTTIKYFEENAMKMNILRRRKS